MIGARTSPTIIPLVPFMISYCLQIMALIWRQLLLLSTGASIEDYM